MNQTEAQNPAAPDSSADLGPSRPSVQGSPSLRSMRGNRNSDLWGEVAALLARGPILRDIDDE